jgi:hypothetical protein
LACGGVGHIAKDCVMKRPGQNLTKLTYLMLTLRRNKLRVFVPFSEAFPMLRNFLPSQFTIIL